MLPGLAGLKLAASGSTLLITHSADRFIPKLFHPPGPTSYCSDQFLRESLVPFSLWPVYDLSRKVASFGVGDFQAVEK